MGYQSNNYPIKSLTDFLESSVRFVCLVEIFSLVTSLVHVKTVLWLPRLMVRILRFVRICGFQIAKLADEISTNGITVCSAGFSGRILLVEITFHREIHVPRL